MKQKVYLAGKVEGDWREKIIKRVDSAGKFFLFFCPSDHGFKNAMEYTAWDIHFVKKCDILFAYIQKDDLFRFGTMAEIGYAKALNKTIILVNEKPEEIDEESAYRHLLFVENLADICFRGLNEGMNFLKSLKR